MFKLHPTSKDLVFVSSELRKSLTRPLRLGLGQHLHLSSDLVNVRPDPICFRWERRCILKASVAQAHYLCGVWQGRVVQKQCSYLQLDLFHHVEWLEWIYKETLTELTEPAADGEYFSSFPRSLPSLPPPSSYISLYSHLHLRSNALL
jgi:hypothetical protein